MHAVFFLRRQCQSQKSQELRAYLSEGRIFLSEKRILAPPATPPGTLLRQCSPTPEGCEIFRVGLSIMLPPSRSFEGELSPIISTIDVPAAFFIQIRHEQEAFADIRHKFFKTRQTTDTHTCGDCEGCTCTHCGEKCAKLEQPTRMCESCSKRIAIGGEVARKGYTIGSGSHELPWTPAGHPCPCPWAPVGIHVLAHGCPFDEAHWTPWDSAHRLRLSWQPMSRHGLSWESMGTHGHPCPYPWDP